MELYMRKEWTPFPFLAKLIRPLEVIFQSGTGIWPHRMSRSKILCSKTAYDSEIMAGLTRIHRAATSALWQAIASSKVISQSQDASCPKAIYRSQVPAYPKAIYRSQATVRPEASSLSNATARTETASRLLDNYGNHILRLAYTYVHNLSDAEDILQDTLVQYLKTTPVFENAAHEKAWLLRTAANLSKNRIKYNRLRTTDELNEELIAEEREDLSFVWEAVSQLPVSQREIIHLFYEEGYSTAQIATIVGRRESTVRSDLTRARKRLKTILKEAYDFA